MRHGAYIVAIAAAIAAGVSPAFGQQDRKVGLVMGYPASVGVLWHVTERVALRPDFTVSRQRIESTLTSTGLAGNERLTTSQEGWTGTAGLSALFYLGPPDAFRLYVSPRVAYVWSNSRVESGGVPGLTTFNYDQDSSGALVAGSMGAQYAPHDRFRIFGEVGLSYSTTEGTSGLTLSRSETKTSGFGLRSGVGVVVYF
jgi:hypothetical protein